MDLALDRKYLQGVIEEWEFGECWCGYGFEDVVASFIITGTSPSFIASVLPGRVHDPALFKALDATFEENPDVRKAGLISNIEALLRTTSKDEDREVALRNIGGSALLEYSDFWSGTGDACEAPLATNFLEKTLVYANGVAIPHDPPFGSWENHREQYRILFRDIGADKAE